MLNCNRRILNECNQLEIFLLIFMREVGGVCNVLWDGCWWFFFLKFVEVISVN